MTDMLSASSGRHTDCGTCEAPSSRALVCDCYSRSASLSDEAYTPLPLLLQRSHHSLTCGAMVVVPCGTFAARRGRTGRCEAHGGRRRAGRLVRGVCHAQPPNSPSWDGGCQNRACHVPHRGVQHPRGGHWRPWWTASCRHGRVASGCTHGRNPAGAELSLCRSVWAGGWWCSC